MLAHLLLLGAVDGPGEAPPYTGPEEPVSLELVKEHLRIVDDTSQDALIRSYTTAAREWVEKHTGLVLVQRAFVEQRDSFGRFIELYRLPITANSVDITYTDTSGVSQAYEDAVYSVERRPGRIYPALNGWWPSVGSSGSIEISYTAGFAPGDAPQALIQAILLLVGHWFVNREAASERPANEVPFAVLALCDQYRMPVL